MAAADNTVLLSYTASQRDIVTFFAKLLSIVFIFSTLIEYLVNDHNLRAAVVFAVLSEAAVILPFALFTSDRIAVELQCFDSWIIIKGLRGNRFDIPWEDVQKLRIRTKYWPLGTLVTASEDPIDLSLISREAEKQLAVLLRQKSDARVAGLQD